MKRNAYSFDPLCLELASHFLPDSATEDAKNELAQVIQDAVEAHLLSPHEGQSLNCGDTNECHG